MKKITLGIISIITSLAISAGTGFSVKAEGEGVGTGGTGVRSYTDASGNIFLGNKYIEVGVAGFGSFGTSKAAPLEDENKRVFFHPNPTNVEEYSNAIGLRSDGDGWGKWVYRDNRRCKYGQCT